MHLGWICLLVCWDQLPWANLQGLGYARHLCLLESDLCSHPPTGPVKPGRWLSFNDLWIALVQCNDMLPPIPFDFVPVDHVVTPVELCLYGQLLDSFGKISRGGAEGVSAFRTHVFHYEHFFTIV